MSDVISIICSSAILIFYLWLVFMAIRRVTQQDLSCFLTILWVLVILAVPLAILLPFFVYPDQKQKWL